MRGRAIQAFLAGKERQKVAKVGWYRLHPSYLQRLSSRVYFVLDDKEMK